MFLRPIGSPVGLGFAGLVGASLITSGLELQWLAPTQGKYVGLLLLAFPFPLQLSASILAFLARDGVIGTAMGVLAGTWLGEALAHLALAPGARSGALGLLLLAAAGLLVAAAAAAALGKLVPAAVLGVESLRFALLGVYELSGVKAWEHAGGVVGLVVVALAGYAVLAAVLEDAAGKPVLSLLRRGAGLAALAGGAEAQVAAVEHEPGVRKQL